MFWQYSCSCREQVIQMLIWSEDKPQYQRYALLFLFAYTFLLRLPSEALPVVRGPVDTSDTHAVIEPSNDSLVLKLKRRKNKPEGSTLRRTCWCSKSPRACPVHVLGRGTPFVSCCAGLHDIAYDLCCLIYQL